MSIGVAFHEIARTCSRVVGSPWAFLTAVAAVVVWAATGPLFGYDELIRAVRGARNRLVDLEEMTDEELEALREQFRRLKRCAATAGRDAGRGG